MEEPRPRSPIEIARELVIILALSAVAIGFVTALHMALPSIAA